MSTPRGSNRMVCRSIAVAIDDTGVKLSWVTDEPVQGEHFVLRIGDGHAALLSKHLSAYVADHCVKTCEPIG